jgi:hypothetical protein
MSAIEFEQPEGGGDPERPAGPVSAKTPPPDHQTAKARRHMCFPDGVRRFARSIAAETGCQATNLPAAAGKSPYKPMSRSKVPLFGE